MNARIHSTGEERGVAVALRNVTRRYGEGDRAVTAIEGMSFTVRTGEFVCVLGSSGCGKSTLLHLIAGLEAPSAGSLALPESGAALLFQDAALFPWLSVADNVAFPLKMRGVGKKERAERVASLLEMVHLRAFGDRQPHELSGGMRQRVALARALAQEASVLLMDEPFAALDALMRDRLHDELERVWSETGLTVIFVTHNVREAVRLADRVLVLASRPGRVAGTFAVNLPRPRRIESAEVALQAAEILACLVEVRSGVPEAEVGV